jgi:hypothetical protein
VGRDRWPNEEYSDWPAAIAAIFSASVPLRLRRVGSLAALSPPRYDFNCSLKSKGAAESIEATASLKQRSQVQIALIFAPSSPAVFANEPSRSPSCVVTKLYGKDPNTRVIKYGLTGIAKTPQAMLRTLYGSSGKSRARRR